MKRIFNFWIFIALFKFAACIHYNAMSVFGERVLPIWVVGIFIGLASVIQLILDVPAGFLLDKYGYKKLLKLTTLFFMFAATFLLFGLNRWTYLITLFLATFGWLFFSPGVNAYTLAYASKENAGKLLSISEIAASVGVFLSGVFLSFFLSHSYTIMVIIMLVIFLLALIFISRIPEDKENAHTNKKILSHGFFIKRIFLNKVFKAIIKLDPASLILIMTKLGASTFYAIIWFVVPLMIVNNVGGEVMGISLGVFDLAIILTGFLLGKLVDKFNKRILVFLGLLIFSIAGILLGWSSGWIFLILSFIATVGDELTYISLWAWLNSLCKDENDDGLVSGIVGMFEDLGWAIGPIVAGILYSNVGPQMTIMSGGLVLLILFIVYLFKFSNFNNNFYFSTKRYDVRPHRHRHKK